MSKVKVKFIYGGDHTVSVNEARSGPINWNSLTDLNATPNKKQIIQEEAQQPPALKEPSILDYFGLTKKDEDKTALNTYKSAETLPTVKTLNQEQSVKKKPTLNIEDADEADFSQVKHEEKEREKEMGEKEKPGVVVEKAREQPSIRGPSYKVPPKGGKARKEYTKGDNAEKYLYSGIPEKDEDEFVGCFGCMRRKPRTYSVGRPAQ